MLQIDQGDSNNLVVVISGPSGVGKDAAIAGIKESGLKFQQVVTATTRDKRPGESDGIDYFFLSKKEFKNKIHDDEFLEHALVYGNYYGVLRSEVKHGLINKIDLLIKVDVQGALALKKKIPDAVFIFLLPPSEMDLLERIKNRNTDSHKNIHLRISTFQKELKSLPVFDYAVVNYNNDLNKTVETLRAIITAEKCRVNKRAVAI